MDKNVMIFCLFFLQNKHIT